MSFEDILEQKKILDLVKKNWNMSLSMRKFNIKYQLDYMSCIATFLKMGRIYYENPELTIDELQKLFNEEYNKSKETTKKSVL